MLSEIDMWDEEYDSDDDASDCSYGTQLEDDGPPTPVFEFEHYDEDEGFEGGYVDEHPSMPKTPWNTPGFGSAETLLPEMSSFVKDDELASYHFHYLAPPPARRQHPFKEPKFEYEDAVSTPRVPLPLRPKLMSNSA